MIGATMAKPKATTVGTVHYVRTPRARETACGFKVSATPGYGKGGPRFVVRKNTTTDETLVTCGRCKRRK